MRSKSGLIPGILAVAAVILVLTASPGVCNSAVKSLGVDKTPVWLNLEKGKTASFTILLSSDGEGFIEAQVMDYIFDQGGLPLFFRSRREKWSAAEWLSFNPKRVKVKGKCVTPFVFMVKVPANCHPGTHNAAIFFGERGRKTDGISFSIRIGSRLTVLVPGKTVIRCDLDRYGVKRRSDGKTDLWAAISNRGSSHFLVTGSVRLEGPQRTSGEMVSSQPILLPGESRNFNHMFGGLEPGTYQAVLKFSVAGKIITKVLSFSIPKETRLSQKGLIVLVCLGSIISFMETLFDRRKERG